MKKIILIGLLITGSLFAHETNDKIPIDDFKTTKALLSDMKEHLPVLYTVYNDYFQAKTCSKDISKTVSIKEIRDFSTTALQGQLVLLKFDDKILSKASYDALISSYKFMNCGDTDQLGIFTGSVSTMSVELDAMLKEK
jgi:hypothetical protein